MYILLILIVCICLLYIPLYLIDSDYVRLYPIIQNHTYPKAADTCALHIPHIFLFSEDG